MSNIMRTRYRELSVEENARMDTVKELGQEFYDYLESIPGDSRELSLAKTKIEEAVMWAVKHVTG